MKNIRERSLCLESLEDRMLLAVTAGGEEVAASALYAAPLATEAAQLDTPANIAGSCTTARKVDLTWDAVDNASGYTVYYKKLTATSWTAKTTTTNSFTITGTPYGNYPYSFKVVANGDGTNYTNSEESAEYNFQAFVGFSTTVTTLSDSAYNDTSNGVSFRTALYCAALNNEAVTFADGLSGTIDLAANGHIKDIYGDVIIDGEDRITITNSSTDGQGRLFLLYNYDEYISTISFKNITLTGATATSYHEFNRNGDSGYTEDGAGFGSAIMLYSPSSQVEATFDNVTITGCTGTQNGTLYLYGVSDLTMTNCTFTGNQAGDGGGFFLTNCENFTIQDCVFSGNAATDNGGGVVIDSFTDGVIDNCRIVDNAVYGASGETCRGGGLYVKGTYDSSIPYAVYSTVTLYDTTISGNTVDIDPDESGSLSNAGGGGVCIHNSNFTTNECVISENSVLHASSSQGGGVFAIFKDQYGYEYTANGGGYRPYNGTVRFNKTYFTGNCAGSTDMGYFLVSGGAVWASGNLIFVDSVLTDNAIYCNGAGYFQGSAVYDYCNTRYVDGNPFLATSMFVYYSTIAGNKAYALNGSGIGEQSAGIRDFGNSYLWGSTILGNQTVDMNGTPDDDSDDIAADADIWTFALEENLVALPRVLSCAVNPDTMTAVVVDTDEGKLYGGYIYGTYYDDADCTTRSANQSKDGGAYLKDDNVYVSDYESFYNDYANGDYTLAENSAAVDAMNMDLWGHGFGYEYDIRGEGYYRLVNDIADIGAYELQVASPTFVVTITDYEGDYDGEAHSITVSGTEDGDVVYYSADGETYSTDEVAYTEAGAYTVYVKVEREGYQDFTGSGTVTINEVSPGQQLETPTISTGARGVYVSYGANRHQIQWGEVENASGYELQYSADGTTWTSIETTDTSAVVTGLTYGTEVTYRVRALGDDASYTDSQWSAAKDFLVCPMDINNDGDISGGDRTLMGLAWFSEEGDDEYQYYCDINGDGDVSGADRGFLSSNWMAEADEEDLTYPPAKLADALFADFASADLDVDLGIF